jgi:glycosyltransferase involved in cell wall biosynthesis
VASGELQVLHTVNSLRAAHGGPSRSITALARATMQQGHRVQIVAHCDEPQGDIVQDVAVPVILVPAEPLKEFFGHTGYFRREVDQVGSPPAVVHDHGLWLPVNRASSHAARRNRWPRIISLRGMLSEWALGQSRRKKRFAWFLYQRRDLDRARAIHTTSAMELQELRNAGVRVPAAVIPNGVQVPLDIPEDTRRTKRLLFLSRIHPKKGVDHLLEAWEAVDSSGWTLTIAGPAEDGKLADRVRQAAARDQSVEVIGAVDDRAKWDLYRSADLFVLPTLSENFGIVIAEALAAGVPVITTKAAPWEELESHDCGCWIDPGAEPLVAALRDAMARSDAERQAMGARGRKLVEENYSWENVAEQMIEVYEWMLGRRSMPDCVDV